MTTRTIWCCACSADVEARLTNGAEIYPRRPDLAQLPFWICDTCGNRTGCHHKREGVRNGKPYDKTQPLGCIPSPELAAARRHIHEVLDPIWQHRRIKRKEVYEKMAELLGLPEYHTAELRTIEDARAAYRAAVEIAKVAT